MKLKCESCEFKDANHLREICNSCLVQLIREKKREELIINDPMLDAK